MRICIVIIYLAFIVIIYLAFIVIIYFTFTTKSTAPVLQITLFARQLEDSIGSKAYAYVRTAYTLIYVLQHSVFM